MKRRTRGSIVGATVAAGLLAMTGVANATYHENLIREVHAGTAGTGDYVELQAYAAGQNFVFGKHIVSYDGGGGALSTYTIPSNVANGANQATILISNGGVPGADFVASPGSGNDGTHLTVDNTGGAVCYTDSVVTVGLDCVALGGNPATMFPTPAPSPYGSPFILPGSPLAPDLRPNRSIIRTISRGCATQLDPADDTNNTAADFTLGAGNPRGNATTPTETACPVTPVKKKCKKKKKKHHSAAAAKKKKCKKKHKRK
jgi:hypothetical protein